AATTAPGSEQIMDDDSDNLGDSIKKSWDDSLLQLAYLDGDDSKEAKLRRIAIYDAQCDFMTGMAKVARDQGNTDAAHEFESIANSCWGQVIALASELSTD